MTDRLACSVPHCHRTRHNREGFSEWICATHWQMVSKHYRRRYSRFRRAYKRRFGDNHFGAYPCGSPDRIAALRLDKICVRAWAACRRQAIEIGMGIL
jgi:hypothetical protein